ncbi:MAG: FIST C-terminal domain-containing protein [Polyangiales bacterium]
MGTQCASAFSQHRDPRQAGKEAVTRALAEAGIDRPDFVFLFGTIGYDQKALVTAARAAASGAPLVGCTGEGVISKGTACEENFGVVAMVIKSDEMRFQSVNVPTGLKENAADVGRQLANQVKTKLGKDEAKALFLFTDGIAFNFDKFSVGLWETLKPERFIPLLGGLAGENFTFDKTYQYCDDEVFTGGLACAVLTGDARLAWAVNHGCKAIGTEHTITKASGNVIQEIDGKPAVEAVIPYMLDDEQGNWTRAVVNLSVGVKAPAHLKEHEEYLCRTILDMMQSKSKTGAMALLTEFQEGTKIHILRRDADRLAAGVQHVVKMLKAQLGDHKPKLCFQFDCSGRGKFLLPEEKKLENMSALQDAVGPTAPWMGFYCYGEIGPLGQNNCVHNLTVVAGAIY